MGRRCRGCQPPENSCIAASVNEMHYLLTQASEAVVSCACNRVSQAGKSAVYISDCQKFSRSALCSHIFVWHETATRRRATGAGPPLWPSIGWAVRVGELLPCCNRPSCDEHHPRQQRTCAPASGSGGGQNVGRGCTASMQAAAAVQSRRRPAGQVRPTRLPSSSCRLPPSQAWLKKRARLPRWVASMFSRTAAVPLGSHSRSTCEVQWRMGEEGASAEPYLRI